MPYSKAPLSSNRRKCKAARRKALLSKDLEKVKKNLELCGRRLVHRLPFPIVKDTTTTTETTNMTNARDYTKIGSDFEAFVANNVACPACGSAPLGVYPPSYPTVDLFCQSCPVRINAKRNLSNDHTTHPQSLKALRALQREIGARNIYFAIGTETALTLHCLASRKITKRNDRFRGKKRIPQTRVSFRFSK
jgi:hypothetical protein